MNTFSLEPLPPFQLEFTVWALRRRPDNAVDSWDGKVYRRVLALKDQLVEVAVTQLGPPDTPRLQVEIPGARLTPAAKSTAVTALNRLLGLQIDLSEFYRLAAQNRRLRRLAERFRGLKPPRFPSLFEALVNAIVCQQITLTFGIQILNGLAENCGVAGNGSDLHAFPRPSDLAGAAPEKLKTLKLSRQKVRAITELSGAVVEGRLDLEGLSALDDEAATTRLRQLWGVGRWTAEYTLLRGLGRLHVFPGDDVGARNNLQRWLGLKTPLDYEDVHRVLAQWRPYAGFIYLHLLLNRLAETGMI
ncbi:MAG: DNA-3-methyladenine glycosylase 2 [Blastocatellia bacterium]